MSKVFRIVYPGSFRILHAGHLAVAAYAESKYGKEVLFEICSHPFDKPPLSQEEMQKRKGQFDLINRRVEFTDCSSFVQKANQFPGRDAIYKTLFLIGSDTLARIQDPKYYFGSEKEMDRCIGLIYQKRCSFLAFPRPNKIETIPDLDGMVEWADMPFMNISSTQLKNKSPVEETFGPFEEKKKKKTLIKYAPFNSIILIDGDVAKIIPGSAERIPGRDLYSWESEDWQVTIQKNEEFFQVPFDTKVRIKCRPVNS